MHLVRPAEHPTMDPPVRSNHICKPTINPLRRSLGETSSTNMEDDVMGNSRTANASTHQPTFAAMSRLIVGNPYDVHGPESIKAWHEVELQFAKAKRRGITAISTDVWWGLIEPSDGVFNFEYTDRLLRAIKSAGLKWVVILSLHQCGGNVGDGLNDVPIPRHVWDILGNLTPTRLASDVMYVSEYGNQSVEYVSCWATDLALPLYERMFRAFQKHYAAETETIVEVNVSLGPAGELRHPSYNIHDFSFKTGRVAYPTRGALQCYSALALTSFRRFAIGKYGDLDGVRQAWLMDEKTLPDINAIRPPSDADYFFKMRHCENLQYGRDFIDWYSSSLWSSGEKILSKAFEVFGSEGSAFAGIDIGAKVPGIHWCMGSRAGNSVMLGSRQAELCAGLIQTSQNDWDADRDGRGYRPLLSMFERVQQKSSLSRLVIHFTCLEMDDGRDGVEAQSLARTLVRWFGKEAAHQGIVVKGENALAGTVYSKRAWKLMRSALKLPHTNGWFEGLTILRVDDICEALPGEELERTVRFAKHVSTRKTTTQIEASASEEITSLLSGGGDTAVLGGSSTNVQALAGAA
jgi:beta-amylase